MIIGGKTTNPGDLRTLVMLAPSTVSVETGGFRRPVPDTAHAVNAWAKWINVHGQEAWTADASGAITPATVTVRFVAGMDPTWYISKDAGVSWFEIVSLDNIRERGEYVELKVQRWQAG